MVVNSPISRPCNMGWMKTTSTERVKKHREKMRKAGFRLVQMWVWDINHPKVRAMIKKDLAAN
jgi:Protein  of unknown function (DUF3018)